MAHLRPTGTLRSTRLLFLAGAVLGGMAPFGFACSSFGSASLDGGSSTSLDAGAGLDGSPPVIDAANPDAPEPDAAVPRDAGARVRVFVTRATIVGRDLSKDPDASAPRNPFQQATQMCAVEALSAGLAGTYTPWLGTSTVDPGKQLLGKGPWYDATGTDVVFTGRPDVGGAVPLRAIVPASGSPTPALVWTGRSADDNCGDWADGLRSGRLGEPNVPARWETNSYATCGSVAAAIYCFEQPPPEISPGPDGI